MKREIESKENVRDPPGWDATILQRELDALNSYYRDTFDLEENVDSSNYCSQTESNSFS